MPGISFHHFTLTFDNYNRPIVKDLGSLTGTEVTYDKEGEGKRSNFPWIVGGHEIPQDKKSIVINVNKDLKFQIVVSRHDITSQQYIDNVNSFRQGTTNAENLFGRLDLGSRPQTERASGAHTPGTGPIVLRKKLGSGSFGVVTHIWDVSTGDESALKQPSREAIRARKVDFGAWKKEADIMGQISHDHIVTFFGAKFTPLPQLHFEYVPGGSLENHHNISAHECVQILRQCLLALIYLHGHEKPFVHRDIKPENILVQSRGASNIYVKLGDFGLTRQSCDPTTICGSRRYLAPELYNEQDRRDAHREKRSYTPAVDIWSLGVTVFEHAYGLPYSNAKGVSWCKEIVKKLMRDFKRHPDDLNQFLLDTMVIMEPGLRGSAQDCYDKVLALTDPGQDRCQTPTPASYAPDYPQPVSQYDVAGQYGEDQETVLLQDDRAAGPWPIPSLDDDSIGSAEIQRYGRSDGPPPDSLASAAKHGSFHESWLQDPLHPFGGGSSMAALGQEIFDSGSWRTPSTERPRGQNVQDDEDLLELPKWAYVPPVFYDSMETRKRPKWSSKSSSSSGRQKKRPGHSSIAARSSGRKHDETPEPETAYYHKEYTNEEYGSVLQGVPEEPSRAEPRRSGPQPGVPGSGYHYGSFPDSGASAQDTYVPNHTQGWREGEQIVGGVWTDSEARLAETLLREIRRDS